MPTYVLAFTIIATTDQGSKSTLFGCLGVRHIFDLPFSISAAKVTFPTYSAAASKQLLSAL